MSWTWELLLAALAFVLLGSSYILRPYTLQQEGMGEEFGPNPLHRAVLISGASLFLAYFVYELIEEVGSNDFDLFTVLIVGYLTYMIVRILLNTLRRPRVRFDHGARSIFRRDQLFLSYDEVDRLEFRPVRRLGNKKLKLVARLRDGSEVEVMSTESKYRWFRENVSQAVSQGGLSLSNDTIAGSSETASNR